MNAHPRVVFAALAAVVCASLGDAQPGDRGIIYGRVVDARTCSPVLASIVVKGTRVGAMVDRNGFYQLRDVPPGKQDIRVQAMMYQSADFTVDVIANDGWRRDTDSTRVDVTLRELWSSEIPPRPSSKPARCPEHSARMKWVLVPTTASETFVLLGSRNRPGWPNAWPSVGGAFTKGAAKVGWGQSCEECVDAWNAFNSQDRWAGLVDRFPESWGSYFIPRTVDLVAPRGLVDSVAVDSCSCRGSWSRTDLRIEVRRMGPTRDVFFVGKPAPPRGDYVVFEAIDGCKASIWVTEDKNYMRLVASVASTTTRADNLDIVIIASGKKASEMARTILGTMLLPGPDDP